MALNKQMHIYSVDTSAFYTEDEMVFHRRLSRLYMLRAKINKHIEKAENENDRSKLRRCNKLINKNKERLYIEFKVTKELHILRTLSEDRINDSNIVSIFDSFLTRTLNLEVSQLSDELVIVQTYFFDVIEDIILNGFMYKGEKYICLTASAGQIRTKKTVFIKESSFLRCEHTITCGLTLDKINAKGGCNVNKYLAYLALANSATDEWTDFDIRKSIVVEDFETLVNCEVDLIDDTDYSITRQFMDVPIPHTDGCGMMLKGKNAMCRLPWVKGLLVVFPFDEFIKEHQGHGSDVGIIEDIYGKEHDIIAEDIQYIFTKSQFKMWKYYDSWDQYIEYYEMYNCTAGKCNEEEDRFKKAKINYQMLQTLTDITDKELKELSRKSREDIQKISSDLETIFKVVLCQEKGQVKCKQI